MSKGALVASAPQHLLPYHLLSLDSFTSFFSSPTCFLFFPQYIYLFCSICSVTHHILHLSVLGMSENFASKGHDAIWRPRHVSLRGLTQHNTHTHTHTKKTWVFQQSALRFNSNAIPHGAFMSAQLQRLHFCLSFFFPRQQFPSKCTLRTAKKKEMKINYKSF